MDFNPIEAGGRVLIQAYGDGGFRILGRRIEGAIVVYQDSVTELGRLRLADIAPKQFQPLLDGEPPAEILLLGCGQGPCTLGVEQRAGFAAAGISLEIMNTGAACRTFNVLQGEGRRVAAVLIAVD